MIKKYNIAKPEKYTKDGQEKTFWANVGTMTEFVKQDGSVSRIVEIPAIGLKANVFLQDPKPSQTTHTPQSDIPIINEGQYPTDSNEVDIKDIPF